jgi:hypothetical protein
VGLPPTTEEESSANAVKKKVFANVLLPILKGAVAAGDLAVVPLNADCILEYIQ